MSDNSKLMQRWSGDNEAESEPSAVPESDLMSRWEQKPVKGCSGCSGGINKAMSLEELYERAERNSSDINEHAPKLRELAELCQHVTEFGHRHAVSSVALLVGQPKRFITYDMQEDHTVKSLSAVAGDTEFEFRVGDSLEVDIEKTDLLFIDTYHNANRLYAELDRHADNVSRFIALHDTAIYGELGDDGGAGLLPAMRRFMAEKSEWTVIYHAINNNGFTVLGILPEDKPELPGKIEMATNFAKALKEHVADGLKTVDTEELKRRLEICSICPQRNGIRCTVCGCSVEKKASWKEQMCPIGKW